MVTVDSILEDRRWTKHDIAALAERACDATLAHLGIDGAWEVAVLACDDARIAALNATFRERPRATNVLSWPAVERAAASPGDRPRPPDPTGDRSLGDIAIAFETCADEAEAAGLTLADHATHLLVHAMLHLLGYDHQTDGDAALMERTETEILASLGVSDPYR